MKKNFKVKLGSAVASPGEKGAGSMLVKERNCLVKIPVGVLNGKENGPHMVVIAAQHGEELNGIAATYQLFGELNPENLSGTLFFVFTGNPLAIEIRKRGIKKRNGGIYNMSPLWPGEKGRNITSRMCYELWNQAILSPHKKADFVMDIHSHRAPSAVYAQDIDQIYHGIISGIPFIIHTPVTKDYRDLTSTCSKNRIKAICIEPEGQVLIRKESVDDTKRAMRNIMKHLGMLKGDLDLPEWTWLATPWRTKHSIQRPSACRRGLALLRKKELDAVKKGEVICELIDIQKGQSMQKCISSIDGVLYVEPYSGLVDKGGRLFTVSEARLIKPKKYINHSELLKAFIKQGFLKNERW